MFHHTGQRRTHKNNIRLALLLCMSAGVVNVTGFIAFGILTTNVTGHVAVFADQLSNGNFSSARMVGLWMLTFLAGAFFSSLWLRLTTNNKRFAFTVPIIVEIIILLLVGYFGYGFDYSIVSTEIFGGSLLFAMGLQNALVSEISGSVVRTTHLTGMFTDLGIALAKSIYGDVKTKAALRPKIMLYLVIIFFFFFGGIAGGLLFKRYYYHTFYLPAFILMAVMIYDMFRFKTVLFFRRVKSKRGLHSFYRR
ncbi:YoaK family protein [Arcticibacter eurypsychrophilus]|uniref:YoaK family protein n=1 Tax=Arcticibacter eurypsychrophilus TaxID=1434752 RepID=UPI00084D129E|nr:YoaK family protein [Arcticibacter eurypsychrophilus]